MFHFLFYHNIVYHIVGMGSWLVSKHLTIVSPEAVEVI